MSAGRKLKLNEDKQEKICSMIRNGAYASQAAKASGIGERTYHRWIKEGSEAAPKCEEFEDKVECWNEMNDAEKRLQPHLKPSEKDIPTEKEYILWQFWLDIKKAEAEAEMAAVFQIRKAAGSGTWQAAAWYLERKYKDRWGRNDTVKHEGQVQHQHTLGVPQDELEAARAELAEARKQLTSGEDSEKIFMSNQEDDKAGKDIEEVTAELLDD